MCERWTSFENFLADMGEKPEGLTLDRIDVNGNYEPGNCRWVGWRVQARNKQYNVSMEFRGVTKLRAEWAEEFGIPLKILRGRLRIGWNVERALTVPVGPVGWGRWARQKDGEF